MSKKYVGSILPLVEARQNIFLEELNQCKMSGLPTWIYGAGEGADNVQKRAEGVDIEFAGRCVDKGYYVAGNGYECLENILAKNKINLVVAHNGFKKCKLDVWGGAENINILIDRDCFSGNYEADPEFMTFDYVKEHDKELTDIYNALEDDKSRRTMLAYIDQKISMDYRFLEPERVDGQYFDIEVVRLGEDEALVDAGAYIGDTAENFVKEINKRGINKYDAIYSFEPDVSNYDILSRKNLDNFFTYQIAVSDRVEKVFFQSRGKGSSSGVSVQRSGNAIKADRIDHILEGKKVSFIKMDVEGYELSALRGAKRTICKQRPKMAICIYHKRSDLWEIMNYITSVVEGYTFYMRAYERTATELVLYALPAE